MPARAAGRRADLDNLRTFLTALVICHHSAIAFGASGGWYFVVPPPPDSLAPLLLTIFTGVNQAFFMALFFAIAAHFTPPAFEAKGPWAFLRDRFARLGIPLVVYSFLLNPVVVYLAQRFQGHAQDGLFPFLAARGPSAFGTGPLWFVLALLLMSAGYVAFRMVRPGGAEPRAFPDDRQILRFVVAIGLVAFVVRLAFPVGWAVLGLQLGYFPLYVAFFVFGARSARSGWLDAIDARRARPWLRASLAAIVAMPAVILLGGGLSGRTADFTGGFAWQALAYALWEPLVCVGISLALLALFRRRFATATPFSMRMTRSAYTAYILHPFFVVPLTALIAGLPGGPLGHFVLLGASAVAASFMASDVVRRAPLLRRIL